MIRSNFIFSLCLFIVFTAEAQIFQWVTSGSGLGQDSGERVAVDDQGNIYVTGHFSGEAAFGGTIFQGNGIFDIFLAKYSPDGELIWLNSAGGPQNDSGYGIDLDRFGNIYITGYFTQNATFGSFGGNRITMNSKGSTDIFIAKYDTSGALIWVEQAGSFGEDRGTNLKLDKEDNIYITGYFSEIGLFGNHSLPSSGSTDAFVAKYDSNGNALWVEGLGGTGLDKSLSLAVDTFSNVYMTGFFYYDANLSNSSIVLNGVGLSSDIFMAKYDLNGTNKWAKRLGGPYNDSGFGIAADGEENVYITGYFLEEATFGNYNLLAHGYNDVYVAKYDTSLKCVWALNEGGVHLDTGLDIALDKEGDVYVTGIFDSVGRFGNETLISAEYYDLFVTKYNKKGIYLWTRQAGGEQGDFSKGMLVDNGFIYVTGYYKHRAMFGDIEADYGVEADVFLTKLSVEDPVGTEDIEITPDLTSTPNPNQGSFFIRTDKIYSDLTVQVVDINGKVILRKDLKSNNNFRIPVAFDAKSSGIYFVTIATEDFRYTERVLVF